MIIIFFLFVKFLYLKYAQNHQFNSVLQIEILIAIRFLKYKT